MINLLGLDSDPPKAHSCSPTRQSPTARLSPTPKRRSKIFPESSQKLRHHPNQRVQSCESKEISETVFKSFDPMDLFGPIYNYTCPASYSESSENPEKLWQWCWCFEGPPMCIAFSGSTVSWSLTVPCTIPCITMQYNAIPCNIMQTCNAMQYHAVSCCT